MVRITFEPVAQFRILSGYAYRTGIHMTLTHHDTTFHHQGGGGDTPFFRTQQSGHCNIPSGL